MFTKTTVESWVCASFPVSSIKAVREILPVWSIFPLYSVTRGYSNKTHVFSLLCGVCSDFENHENHALILQKADYYRFSWHWEHLYNVTLDAEGWKVSPSRTVLKGHDKIAISWGLCPSSPRLLPLWIAGAPCGSGLALGAKALCCQEQHSHPSRFLLLGELLSMSVIRECSRLRGTKLCYHTIASFLQN